MSILLLESLRRSNKLNLKSNSNPWCNFLSRVGSSRSYPRETKAFRFAVGRDKPWNLSQVPVDTSVRRWNFLGPFRGKPLSKRRRGRRQRLVHREREGKRGFSTWNARWKERGGLVSHSHAHKLPHEVRVGT